MGKTFVGSEKSVQLGTPILLVCQASKVKDWVDHYKTHYPNLTVANMREKYTESDVYILNYDLVWRRDLPNVKTLVLDESQNIKNPTAKRTKVIIKCNCDNVVLLSGTPDGGKLEDMYTQLKLLGLGWSKKKYIDKFCDVVNIDYGTGFKVPTITGYKNLDEFYNLLSQLNCVFMKTEEAIDLPKQNFIYKYFDKSKKLKKFEKTGVVDDYIGESTMSQMIGERKICTETRQIFYEDLLSSTNNRLVIFYNFIDEFYYLKSLCEKLNKPISWCNGDGVDLTNYNDHDNSVILVQYQSGSSGLNLQKCNQILYYSLPLSSIMFEQSKKRIHRVGQDKPCFYYVPICKGSIEEHIYHSLKNKCDFSEKLFKNVLTNR